jgi:hypothetical protein
LKDRCAGRSDEMTQMDLFSAAAVLLRFPGRAAASNC